MDKFDKAILLIIIYFVTNTIQLDIIVHHILKIEKSIHEIKKGIK